MSVRADALRPVDSLPVELTPMLGRERECAQLRELLDDPSIRLVTVTGPGGVGKTRLAVHVAASLDDAFGDAIASVPLAAIRDPALVLPAIAQAFGIATQPAGSPQDAIASQFRDVPALLILDNLEQVSEVAPALADILARCRRVTILATSRVPLNISGEQLFPLAPLPTPASGATTGDIERSDAVQLFLQRARSLNPGMDLNEGNAATIAEICRRLDGLPLAIELAAARTRILSPEALLARLSNRLRVLGGERRDLPGRLRTMRGAIAWSYDLLSPAEQALFRRLSVFAGGFSLDAVEAISPSGDLDAFDLLGALVDHSMIQSDHVDRERPRFLMLETLRDYGLEELESAGEAGEARLAHASWAADLAESVATRPVAEEQWAWQALLDPEVENLRAAAEWSLSHRRPLLALRIGNATWQFCTNRGLTSACRDWLTRALAEPGVAGTPEHLQGLVSAGHLAEHQRDLAVAESLFEEAVRLAGDEHPGIESRALSGLGFVNADRGDYAAAIGFHQRVAALAEHTGDPQRGAVALKALGDIAYFQGRFADARSALERSREQFAALGDIQAEALCSTNLGAVANDQGDAVAAERYLTHALTLQRQIDSRRYLPITLINLGGHAFARGDFARVRELFEEAIQLLRETGDRRLLAIALHGPAALAREDGNLAESAAYMIESIGLHAEVEDRLSVVEAAEFIASLCSAGGDWATAVELLAAAAANREILRSAASAATQRENDAIVDGARGKLAGAELSAAWDAGTQLDTDALVRRMTIVTREIAGPRQPAITTLATGDAGPETTALTPREREVLRLLVDGQSTGGIAEALYIAPRTAGTHIANVLGKLGVTSRTAAVALALRQGLA